MSWTRVWRSRVSGRWVVQRGMSRAVTLKQLPDHIKLRLLLASKDVSKIAEYDMGDVQPIDAAYKVNDHYLLYLSCKDAYFLKEGRMP